MMGNHASCAPRDRRAKVLNTRILKTAPKSLKHCKITQSIGPAQSRRPLQRTGGSSSAVSAPMTAAVTHASGVNYLAPLSEPEDKLVECVRTGVPCSFLGAGDEDIELDEVDKTACGRERLV